MATNPFKAFIPYLVNTARSDGYEQEHAATDPSGGEWRRLGLVPASKGEELIIDLIGAGKVMAVQFNERILPGKVRDEKLQAEVTRLEAREGRKVGKKEYAQLRQQVEFDLLPKAFIRRTVVPVLFYKHEIGKQIMLVCTSSHKRADDVVAVLLEVFGIDLMPWKIETESSVSGVLTTLATNGIIEGLDEESGLHFSALDSAVIKGENKQTIRIKDKPVESQDVQDLLSGEGQVVHELALAWCDDNPGVEEPDLTFTVTGSLIFKRAETIVTATNATEDFYGFAVVCLKTYRDMLTHFFELCGGIKERPASGESTNGSDEDEL